MTTSEATEAMENGTKVEAGEGEDYDEGYIISIEGDMATVAWDSGVRAPCPIADLEIV